VLIFAYGNSYNSEMNYKYGLLAVCFLVYIEGFLKGEKGPFRYFHSFWRGGYRSCLIYCMGLVFIAF